MDSKEVYRNLCKAIDEGDWKLAKQFGDDLLIRIDAGESPPRVLPIRNNEFLSPLARDVVKRLLKHAEQRLEQSTQP